MLTVAFTALSSLSLIAQNDEPDIAHNTFSPYSMFGIGDITRQGTTVNMGMGGVGIAMRDARTLNFMNPAAVTKRENRSVMVDFGLYSENKYYKQHSLKSSNNTFNMYNFAMSFPIYKSFAMYLGIIPFSSVGYEVSSYETDQSIIANTGGITYNADGDGGLNNFFIGGAVELFKGFSIGAEMEYIFGNIHKNYSMELQKSDFRSVYSGYEMKLHTFTGKFGVQYELPINSGTLIFGSTYRLKSNLRGTVKDIEYSLIDSIRDTSRNEVNHLSDSKNVKIAEELGVGIGYRMGDKWTAEVNYLMSKWSNCGMDVKGFANEGNSTFTSTISQSVRAGFSLVPNRNDIRYYMKSVTYRAGVYWDRAYYKLDRNTIDAFGLTFGATFPVFRWSNGLSIGFDIGQRGSLSGNNIRERYFNFTLGLNIFDIWFAKPQYD